MQVFTYLTFILILFYYARALTYRAAVVEYSPIVREKNEEPKQVMEKNVVEYIRFIKEAGAKKAQIIVFPEDGITSIEAGYLGGDELGKFSIAVPEASQKISPCNESSIDIVLKNLSCAAIENNIYVIVNLVDRKQINTTNATENEYYNTNVVFDPHGIVIAKFYKINLYYEPGFTPGKDIVTFTTNFNVTFGMLICFDILFENPSITTLKDEKVTDIIYSAAWFSETPYLSAVPTQDGYARANGVNLLASGYDRPTEKNGGSGIYFANGTVAEGYISGTAGSFLIIKDVPINARRTPPESNCSEVTFNEDYIVSEYSANFSTYAEKFDNYTLEPLSDGLETKKVVCSLDFCCEFHVALSEITNSTRNYKYLLAVFHGVRSLGDLTAGLRTCGIIACGTEEVSSCGVRHPNSTTLKFKSISVAANLTKTAHISDRPASLQTHLAPVNRYSYCVSPLKSGQTEIKMTTNEQDSMLSFGFYGRMFELDGKPLGVYRVSEIPSSARANIIVGVVIAILVVLAVVCAFFVYRRSRKYRVMETYRKND